MYLWIAISERKMYTKKKFLAKVIRMKNEERNYIYMKTILFDLDGTLTNPKEGITKCVQYALKYFGIEEKDLDKLLPFIGPPLIVSFQEYYNFDEKEAQKAVEKYRERYSEIGIFENGVYPGIHTMLEQLKRNSVRMALATSKPEVYAVRIMDKYGLSPYFEQMAGSELNGNRNTKAEVIEEALRRLEVPKEQYSSVIMVGDRKHDIEGAKIHGLHTVGVEFGYAKEGELEKAGAEYIVKTIKELEKLLLEMPD